LKFKCEKTGRAVRNFTAREHPSQEMQDEEVTQRRRRERS